MALFPPRPPVTAGAPGTSPLNLTITSLFPVTPSLGNGKDMSSPQTPSTPTSTTSSSLAPITSAAAPHLALFQSLSDHIRSDPAFVIERITEWLCAPDSPRTWAILALCLRATAHESVDANQAAREDYGRVLVLWDDLLNDLGPEKIRRWKVNMQSAKSRFRSLGGDIDMLLKSHKRKTAYAFVVPSRGTS